MMRDFEVTRKECLLRQLTAGRQMEANKRADSAAKRQHPTIDDLLVTIPRDSLIDLIDFAIIGLRHELEKEYAKTPPIMERIEDGKRGTPCS